ncbi:CRE-SCL-22 protein, partial [Aphelenchoides avenae]
MANWNLPVQYGVDSSLAHNENLVKWQYMSSDVLTRLGCAVKMCPAKDGVYSANYLCITGGGWNVNRPTYVAGAACKTDADCTLYPQSVCLVADGLCQTKASYPGKRLSDITQYRRHLAADANTICAKGSPRMNDAARLLMLDHHNFARSNMVKGREAISASGALSPTGSNMYKMVWDCAAEAKSQAWIEDAVGRIPHSTPAYRNYSGDQYGESLYMYTGPIRPARDAVELAINWWFGELAENGWYGAGNHTLTLADLENTDAHQTIGHWSNAAWAKTFRLGCGISKGGLNVCC